VIFTAFKSIAKVGVTAQAFKQLLGNELILGLIESHVNHACQISAGVPQKIQALQGQSINISLAVPAVHWHISFWHEQIILKPGLDQSAQAEIKISLLDLLSTSILQKNSPSFDLEGDLELLLATRKIMQSLDIDLGSILAPKIGPQATDILLKTGHHLNIHLKTVLDKLMTSGQEFISQEQPLLATSSELSHLKKQYRQLHADLERAQARIQRLEAERDA